jgi:hypothetical protein
MGVFEAKEGATDGDLPDGHAEAGPAEMHSV